MALERVVNDDRDSPWVAEHLARYEFASQRVSGRVLDIACGSGIGIKTLLRSAQHVTGLDADDDAIRQASAQADPQRSTILKGDATQLPFPARHFDAVVSFETVEHLERREEFIGELARVMKSDGVCIVSTPNAEYTRPVNGKPKNPFHIHEYTPQEFQALLSKYFAQVEMLGQALAPRFKISPFWEEQQRMPRDLATRTRLLTWKLVYRWPAALRDATGRMLWGHPLVPASSDFEFTAAEGSGSVSERAPVQVAICKRPKG